MRVIVDLRASVRRFDETIDDKLVIGILVEEQVFRALAALRTIGPAP
jgi:hypothetical protein